MDLSIILEITRKHTKEILTIFITPVLIGVIASLIIDNQYTSSATISPKRSSVQDSGSGVGVIAAFAGIDDDKLSPELKFATNYFYSYQFLSGFLIAHDLVDDMLMFQKYDKKSDRSILKDGSSAFEVENLFTLENPRKGLLELKKATKEFQRMIKMVPSRIDPSLAIIEVTHYSPSLSYFILTNLLEALDRDIAQLDIQSSDSQISYINSIIGEYSSIETTRILASILDREFTKKILANSSDQYAFLVLDPPVYPIEKSQPRRSIIVLLSFLLSIFINSAYLGYLVLMNIQEKKI